MFIQNKKENTQSSQPRIIKVTRHRSKTNKSPIVIVHTTIKSLNKKELIKHNQSVQLNHATVDSNHQNTIKCPKKKSHSISVIKLHRPQRSLTKSKTEIISNQNDDSLRTDSSIRSKLSDHEMFSDQDPHIKMKTKEAWSDQKGMTNDYHRTSKKNKKKPCSPKCIIISLVFALIIGLAIAIALIIVIPKSKKQIGSSTTPVLRWNTTGITIAGITNVSGNASDQLNRPADITLDYPNAFYVADRLNHRVQKFFMGSSVGITLAGRADGSSGTTASYLYTPSRVLIDSNENVYVADVSNHRVQLWKKNATTGTTVAGAGGFGSGNNQLITPYGIVRDTSTDTLYIADYGNHRVMAYSNGASFGNITAGGNGNGTSSTQLYYPLGLHLDSLSNSLVIVNHFAPNVVRWVRGASSWTLLANNINTTASSLMVAPTGVTFDPMGNMYIADRDNHRIALFMAGERNAISIAGVQGTSGLNSTLLNQPWSAKLDDQLNLYVTDTNNHRIQKFLRY